MSDSSDGGCDVIERCRNALWPKRWWRGAIVLAAVSASAVCYFGYLDFAPTVIFDTPEATRTQVKRVFVHNLTIDTNTVAVQQSPENKNANLNVTSTDGWILSPNNWDKLGILFGISFLFVWLTGRLYDILELKVDRYSSTQLSVRIAAGITLSWFFTAFIGLVNLDFDIWKVIPLAWLGTVLYAGLIWTLLFIFLLPSASKNLHHPRDVDRYIQKLSRLAQSLLTVGIAGSVGGFLSFAINRAATPRPFVLFFLVGILLFPILGLVGLIHLRIHRIEKEHRSRPPRSRARLRR